ncbi:GGDEF domain-containing protein [Lampropedia aestuarii]|uniref:GGDEF domain-containing protein n=1 Tax=Lampropedia aestuarii TaxID=2562762 RepID=UPI002468AFFB|nr:sensor domain-containing diguanylate cyclase [Lampropedia aestuarii]MDH5857707.1 sensor domain-containing diguanylate cyclase [Lampropedia aestuarii]
MTVISSETDSATSMSLPLKYVLPHLEQVMCAMPIGVLWVQLPEGQVLFSNPAFDQIFGYPKGRFTSLDQLLEETMRFDVQREQLRQTWVDAAAQVGQRCTALPGRELDIWSGEDEFKTILQNGQVLHDQQLLVMTYMDITSIRQNHQLLREYAYKDPLTGLANRRALKEWWEREIWPEKHSVALVLIDLDGFKPINDRLGHTAGDALLRRLGERLTKTVRDRDLVCRLGGDEFVVMLRRPGNAETVATVCARIAHNLHRAIQIEGEVLHIQACMGVCQFPEQALDWDSLFHRADQALYAAKASGRGTWLWAPERVGPELPTGD